MNLNKNYYAILELDHGSDFTKIKKTYYKLSKKHHPDKNGDPVIFDEICQAYKVLTEERSEYDRKSKFGKDYNEMVEFFNIDLSYNHKNEETKYDKFKSREVLNVVVHVDPKEFDGSVEFARYVKCKTCQGSGKDTSTRIAVTNDKGEIKYFDGDDGCDFCEGTGKDYRDEKCSFCEGKGKVGINPCKKCDGERRILGKQKLTNIKLEGEETEIKAMGHLSFYDIGKSGSLILVAGTGINIRE
jgi:DnaJ-class molecular chaperone